MKSVIHISLVFCFIIGCISNKEKRYDPTSYQYAIVIHGGAGNINFKNFSKEKEQTYLNALDLALTIGLDILSSGGSCIDAVENVVAYMEDDTLFNAGKGSVFTNDGKNEMDASIMFGKDLNAGAVAGVNNIKNPIKAARAVMEKSDHVMLTREGATLFAKGNGLEMVDSIYFYTEKRYKQLQSILNEKHGTVGCVALDKWGNICAGTSTGGMTNKKYGRVGDSPIIGAGTYANNRTCGVSATGHGEYFIRYAVAHDISALMEYNEFTIAEAAEEVILKKLVKAGGDGGVVCLDKYGHPAMVFNTNGMFRAYGNSDGYIYKAIFKE